MSLVARLVVLATLAASVAKAATGPIALRIGGLTPVEVTASPGAVPPGMMPVGDQTEAPTGMTSSARERLRSRLEEIARKALESVDRGSEDRRRTASCSAGRVPCR